MARPLKGEAMEVDIRSIAEGISIGGTEYTEGATDATIAGTAILWEDTSDTLRAVSDAKPLPIGGSLIGALTETAPATDTASSGLNGRLQRIAQRLTSLIALIPTSLGQKTKAGSLAVTIASDQDALSVTDTRLPAALGAANAAGSLPVTLANDGVFAVNSGLATDSAATTDTGTFSLISLFKRLLQKVTAGIGIVPINTSPAWSNIGANNTDGVAAMDASNYRSGTLQLTGTWSATVNVQFSLDGGTTWVTAFAIPIGGQPIQSLASNNIYVFAVPPGALMRIRTTAYSSGSVVGNVTLSSIPLSTHVLSGIYATSVSGAVATVGLTAQNNDNQSIPANGLTVAAHPMFFNGTNGDRARNVNALSLLTSSARTTTTDSTDQINYNWRGLLLIVNVTSAGTGSITPSIQVKDSISGSYKTIWTAAAALVANGTYVYALGAFNLDTASFTEKAAILLSRTWRLEMVHNNANSITYSASGDMQL